MNAKENKTWNEFGFFDIPYEVEKKYAQLTPTELVERLVKSISHQDVKAERYFEHTIESEEDEEYLFKWIYNNYLRNEIDDVQSRIYNNQVKPIEDRLSELEKQFKNHRHSADKLYSEKPVW